MLYFLNYSEYQGMDNVQMTMFMFYIFKNVWIVKNIFNYNILSMAGK
jgi:hypothetical protein